VRLWYDFDTLVVQPRQDARAQTLALEGKPALPLALVVGQHVPEAAEGAFTADVGAGIRVLRSER
jgi:AmiR/NasT family two-component response regulator